MSGVRYENACRNGREEPMHSYSCFFAFEKIFFNNFDFFFFFFPTIFISWRLFTLQYCSGFCHTLT